LPFKSVNDPLGIICPEQEPFELGMIVHLALAHVGVVIDEPLDLIFEFAQVFSRLQKTLRFRRHGEAFLESVIGLQIVGS